MTGKRADHGHVDIFVLFNRGPKENYNLKKKLLANGQFTGGQIFFVLFNRGQRENVNF